MKAKVSRGAGFRGALSYVLDEGRGGGKKRPEVVGGNMVGQSSRSLSQEFAAVRQLRPDVGKPVWHASLSLPAGERLSAEKWEAVASDFMQRMGFDAANTPYVVVRHQDTAHDHVHIVGSRVGLDGKVWLGQWEARRAIEATQQIEQAHGLRLTPGLGDARAEKKAASQGEIEGALRTGQPLARQQLQQLCDAASKDCRSFTDYVERLESLGVEVLPVVQQGGQRLTGLSYSLEGVSLKGSDLGKGFTAAGIQKKGISYDKDRDGAAVSRCREREARTGTVQPNRGSEAGQAPQRGGPGPDVGTARPGNGGPGGRDPADAGRHPGAGGQAADRDGRRLAESSIVDGGAGQRAERGDRVHGAGQSGRPESDAGAPGRSPRPGLAGLDNRGPGRGAGGSLGRVLDLAAPTLGAGSSGAEAGPGGDRQASAADTSAAKRVRAADGVAAMRDHVKAKQEAWARQSQALDAEQYRITLMPRREGLAPRNYGNEGHKKSGEPEKFWTAAEVAEKIPQLSRQNARGYDVYVTPIDSRKHYLVIDDMTSASLGEARRVIEPALIQESSKDNYQAVVIVAKDASRPDEQSLANGVVQALNQKWGDKKFSGVIHPFRMAGFSNQKPGRDLAFTRVIETRPGHPCPKAKQVLEASRGRADAQKEQEAAQRSTQERERRLAAIVAVPDGPATGGPEGAPAHAFRQSWNRHRGLAESKGWQMDASKVDYRACKDMLAAGWSHDDVREALVGCSPGLDGRHHAAADYARRTVDAASQDPQVIRAVAALERDRGHDHVPG